MPSPGKSVPGIVSQSSSPELKGSMLRKEPPLQLVPKAGSQSEFGALRGLGGLGLTSMGAGQRQPVQELQRRESPGAQRMRRPLGLGCPLSSSHFPFGETEAQRRPLVQTVGILD